MIVNVLTALVAGVIVGAALMLFAVSVEHAWKASRAARDWEQEFPDKLDREIRYEISGDASALEERFRRG